MVLPIHLVSGASTPAHHTTGTGDHGDGAGSRSGDANEAWLVNVGSQPEYTHWALLLFKTWYRCFHKVVGIDRLDGLCHLSTIC